MRSWRGSRWWSLTAVLFGLLVPGLGGSLLAVLHPCPVGLPWLATATSSDDGTPRIDATPAADHAHHGHHGQQAAVPFDGDAPAHDHGDAGSCSCVGACSTGSSPALAATLALPLQAPVLAGVDRPGFTVVAARLSARLHDLLPPSTAPPAIA